MENQEFYIRHLTEGQELLCKLTTNSGNLKKDRVYVVSKINNGNRSAYVILKENYLEGIRDYDSNLVVMIEHQALNRHFDLNPNESDLFLQSLYVTNVSPELPPPILPLVEENEVELVEEIEEEEEIHPAPEQVLPISHMTFITADNAGLLEPGHFLHCVNAVTQGIYDGAVFIVENIIGDILELRSVANVYTEFDPQNYTKSPCILMFQVTDLVGDFVFVSR